MKRTKQYAISKMYCTCCGNEGIPIPRKNGSYREAGHLKKLFCINCDKIVNHVEIRPVGTKYTYEDFLIEMKYHNFDENGERKMPIKKFFKELSKKEENN